MKDPAMSFSGADRIGHITSVDTSRVYIDVDDHDLLTRVLVGNLIAVVGRNDQEFLIGITDSVTRQLREEALLDAEDEQGRVPIGEAKVDTIRAVLIGTFRTVDGERSNVFKRGADTFPQIDRDCYLIEAGNLQRLMNLLSEELAADKRLQLGHYAIDRTAVAVVDGNRFFQRHASILGSTGAGKSCSVALILERANALNFPNLIVLDIHGEYGPLTEGKGAFSAGYRIAGPGDLDKAANNVLFLPYWLLNREEMMAMLLDRSDQNAPNQASRFTTHVRGLKEETLTTLGKKDVRATFTVDSPIPYSMAELRKRLDDDDGEMVLNPKTNKEKQGDWYGRLTRFLGRLQAKIEDRRYGFLFHPPAAAMEYEWLARQMTLLMGSGGGQRGIKIVDFSEVPSDVLPVVVGVFARLVYDTQFWLTSNKRTPIAIVCDEAHLYLPIKEETDATEKRALDVFERIAKEGRKYGVSLLVVSQRPSDVSRTILSQCNNFLVLRLTNDQDQGVVRRLMPESMAGLTEILPLLDVGEALLLGDAVLLPTRIKLDLPTIKPASVTRDFWTEWAVNAPDAKAIQEAVETLRRQTRPGEER
ncbi:MAG: ATP-binding protein [Candidatus Acidiferrum sp.]